MNRTRLKTDTWKAVDMAGRDDPSDVIGVDVVPPVMRPRRRDTARTSSNWHLGPWWLVLTSLLAVGAAVALERRGVVSTPDGIVYTATSRSLAKGEGLSVPFTAYTEHYSPAEAIEYGEHFPLVHWPPLFPIVLSILQKVGFTAIAAASVLNPALLGVNIYLLGRLTRRLFETHWGVLFAVLLGLVLLVDPGVGTSSILVLHSTTLSEPLFVTLILGSLLLLDRHLDEGAEWASWGAAAAASAALAVKFLGMAAAVTVLAVAISRGSWRLRTRRLLGCLLVIAVPNVGSLLRAQIGRSSEPETTVGDALVELGEGIAAIFVPGGWSSVWMTAPVALAVAAAALLMMMARSPSRSRLVRLAPSFITAALLLAQLVYTRAVVDGNVSLTGRQVQLPHILLLVGVLGAVSSISETNLVGRRVAAGFVATALLLTAATGVGPLLKLFADPVSPPDTSEVAELVAEKFDAVRIFTNIPDVVYVASERTAYLVPCETDYFSGAERPEQHAELEELRDLVSSGEAGVLLAHGRLGRASECLASLDLAFEPGVQARRSPGYTVLLADPDG